MPSVVGFLGHLSSQPVRPYRQERGCCGAQDLLLGPEPEVCTGLGTPVLPTAPPRLQILSGVLVEAVLGSGRWDEQGSEAAAEVSMGHKCVKEEQFGKKSPFWGCFGASSGSPEQCGGGNGEKPGHEGLGG